MDRAADLKKRFFDAKEPFQACVICEKAAILRCSNCHGPTYCSEEHALFHWKHGHGGCRTLPAPCVGGLALFGLPKDIHDRIQAQIRRLTTTTAKSGSGPKELDSHLVNGDRIPYDIVKEMACIAYHMRCKYAYKMKTEDVTFDETTDRCDNSLLDETAMTILGEHEVRLYKLVSHHYARKKHPPTKSEMEDMMKRVTELDKKLFYGRATGMFEVDGSPHYMLRNLCYCWLGTTNKDEEQNGVWLDVGFVLDATKDKEYLEVATKSRQEK